ncbi:MAG TPA: heavy metal-associated domain-containing protein [Thermomicrobiales bacterium]|nr:heavy metal-associated domain-containing protein [Thermomicrobiales bacterium]
MAASPPVRLSALDVDFTVDDMTCASCVGRVERALGKVEVAQEVLVKLATERAHVVIDS